ncbi:MAG: 30S ribosomal protein S10 [Halanaeroarchaeum sp.]
MTVVTRLSLQSGDRDALDGVVADIAATCRRKGAELKGPHSDSPVDHRVSLYRGLDGDRDDQFDPWTYTVFKRRMELYGHEDLARDILKWEFPDSVQVEAEVEQVSRMN